jgi:hypothetical protein
VGTVARALANVLRQLDDFDGAERIYQRFVAGKTNETSGYPTFLHDRGRIEEAERLAQQQFDYFDAGGFKDDALTAATERLRALVALDRRDEAGTEASRVSAMARATESVPRRLAAETQLAQYEAYAGQFDGALEMIGGAIAEAEQRGYRATAFEARFAQALIELRAARHWDAHEHLQLVSRDAYAKGFCLLVREADTTLQSLK